MGTGGEGGTGREGREGEISGNISGEITCAASVSPHTACALMMVENVTWSGLISRESMEANVLTASAGRLARAQTERNVLYETVSGLAWRVGGMAASGFDARGLGRGGGK